MKSQGMLESLRAIVQEVSAASKLTDVLSIIVRRIQADMQTGACSVYLLDPVERDYVLMATEGLNQNAVGNVRLSLNEGLVGQVAAREEPLNLHHAESHPKYTYFPETGEERFGSFLGTPILHQRRVLGVLVVQQRESRRFDEGEEAYLVTVSAQLAALIAHAKATGVLASLTAGDIQDQIVREAVFSGIPSAPGVVIGTAVVFSPAADLDAVPRRKTDNIQFERELLNAALDNTKTDMRALSNELTERLNTEEQALFDVYIRMLDDHSLRAEVEAYINQGYCAQTAWSDVVREHVSTFRSMKDPYLRDRAADVRDLGLRVLAYMQKTEQTKDEFPENAILLGEELAAPTFADVPHDRLAGMVSIKGSRNSHMAILGRALGLPTVMGAVDLPLRELDGCEIIVDGYRGQVIVNPLPEVKQRYNEQIIEEQVLAKDLESLRDQPCVTEDGHRVALWVNTGLRIDTQLSIDRGAEGVGLYRTEVPFFLRDRFPSEEEQRQIYREQLEAFAPRPVTMRTLDVGGDKALPYFPIEEANPFLGWRGIRVTLDHPEIFLTQVRAMLKASQGLNNLRIMLPMISGVAELEESLEMIFRAYDELTEEEGYQLVMPTVGAMIEVPAAVYQIREIARRVDFLSVGTNDLTQYLIAVDRNNSRVANLYDTFHPSVIHALRLIVEGCHKERRQVSVCGEMAGDPLGSVLLVALGYEVLSMSATNLPRVKAILGKITLEESRHILGEILELSHASAVREHLEKAFDRPEISRLFRPLSQA